MDNCPKCNGTLLRARGRFVSEVGSIDVYNEQDMVCVNPKCDNYCGVDLSKPKVVVEIRRTKEN